MVSPVAVSLQRIRRIARAKSSRDRMGGVRSNWKLFLYSNFLNLLEQFRVCNGLIELVFESLKFVLTYKKMNRSIHQREHFARVLVGYSREKKRIAEIGQESRGQAMVVFVSLRVVQLARLQPRNPLTIFSKLSSVASPEIQKL